MIKNIVAFGASVTEQENGYADQLARKLGVKIKKFGYGGMHLSDAGVCFIDKVLSNKPELCLIDWFSTDYMEQSKKTLQCIDTILYKFSQIHCAVVFLIFPERRTDGRQGEKESFYDFCRNALKERNATFIDISDELKDSDLSQILRDSIHTNIHGGGYYAELIKEHLLSNPPHVLEPERFVENAAYKQINKTVVNRVFSKNIDLSLDGNILGIYGIIGRHSGICNIKFDNGIEQKVSLWDRWCHFERSHFNFAIPQYKGRVRVEILQDDFDTSSCKLPVDFTKYRKQIVCREIYWQGTNLVVENVDEGSKLALWKIEAVQLIREIKHFVGKCVKKIAFLQKKL
ncbi:MAG: SGNH/GDSL hydrolase family protein [Treponema sp.]|nr:SGNH/GDSL hydrolase family protein [Treponema sp.]